jgi:hypothetical protein
MLQAVAKHRNKEVAVAEKPPHHLGGVPVALADVVEIDSPLQRVHDTEKHHRYILDL